MGAQPAPPAQPPATHLLVVAGAGGEPRYTAEFHAAARAVVDAARARFGVPDANVVYLGEDMAAAAGRPAARATGENVRAALARTAERARPGDQVWVVLVGHGSGHGEQSRFNLLGPDLSAADFRRLLAPLAAQRVAFVNAASASGDWARVLAGRNRAVVTATKSALERNETTFARHFAAALAAPGADTDKDGGVSLLEAFAYARREVVRAYEQDNRLLTEHAQLDDNGDGVATAEPGPRTRDGALAAALALRPVSRLATADPRVARVEAERAALEGRLTTLRARKDSLPPPAYERELERLLVELARTGQAIRAAERGTAP